MNVKKNLEILASNMHSFIFLFFKNKKRPIFAIRVVLFFV